MPQLTNSQIQDFEDQGVLVLPEFFTEDECDTIQTRMTQLLNEYQPGEKETVFSTTDNTHTQEDYFLTSGDKIRFFYEDSEAIDPSQPLELSLNKVGHALHDLDPVFSSFVRQPKLAQLAADVGFTSPLLLQSMYILSLIHI